MIKMSVKQGQTVKCLMGICGRDLSLGTQKIGMEQTVKCPCGTDYHILIVVANNAVQQHTPLEAFGLPRPAPGHEV